ncbi:hypothetical protein A6R68_12121, partial [Neotoma lepida]
MTVPSAEELDSFKYSDLQNLAKRLGLRANLRADKLLRALKAHLNPETRKENKNQDETQSSAFSCDGTEVEINCEEQAEREPVGHVTKTRRKRKTVHGVPNFQDHSEIKRSDPPTSQNQEKQENQNLKTTTEVPSLPEQSQEDRSAASSGKSEVNDFKRLHEARFKKMESIDEYIQFSQDQSHGPESLKGSNKHSVLSATKMNVRFSAATKDNEHKCSLTKTPARKSPRVTLPESASKGQAVFRTPKLKTTERNSTTAGKLKPWGQSKENGSLNECVSRVSLHRKTYKQPHLHTREEQRKKHEQERKERKAKVLEARRNLVMPKGHEELKFYLDFLPVGPPTGEHEVTVHLIFSLDKVCVLPDIHHPRPAIPTDSEIQSIELGPIEKLYPKQPLCGDPLANPLQSSSAGRLCQQESLVSEEDWKNSLQTLPLVWQVLPRLPMTCPWGMAETDPLRPEMHTCLLSWLLVVLEAGLQTKSECSRELRWTAPHLSWNRPLLV